jgi:hypothetical protein
MPDPHPEIVIDKDKAVFWLDANGCWQNRHGKFRHQKIIRHFHSSIRRDRHGYYLYQENGSYVEKVYFHYEDQALFVFDVAQNREVELILNTRQHVKLRPQDLFIKEDNLYMQMGEETIKFVERGLIKISRLLQEENNQIYIRVYGRRYRLPVKGAEK